MKTATDPRHLHRIKLVQHLFSSSFHKSPHPEVTTIWKELPRIDPLILKAAPEWPLDKLNSVDLAILRLAVYELTIDKKAPYKVIIDEAIELAKEFGSSNSPKFINGALGKLIQSHMHPNLKTALINFLANEFKMDPEAIHPDLNFSSDLNLSETDMSHFFQRLQDALSVDLPEEKIPLLTTVGDLLQALEEEDAPVSP